MSSCKTKADQAIKTRDLCSHTSCICSMRHTRTKLYLCREMTRDVKINCHKRPRNTVPKFCRTLVSECVCTMSKMAFGTLIFITRFIHCWFICVRQNKAEAMRTFAVIRLNTLGSPSQLGARYIHKSKHWIVLHETGILFYRQSKY